MSEREKKIQDTPQRRYNLPDYKDKEMFQNDDVPCHTSHVKIVSFG